MPDTNGPGREQPEKRRFISEKIVRQPMSRRQIVKRFLLLLLTAALFGVIAAVTFVVSKPVAEKYLVKEPETSSTPITIPKDEPETMAPVTEAATEAERETEPIEDILKSAIEKYQFGTDNLNAMYADLREVCQEADKGIVTVHSVRQQMDWFDNPVENTGLFAGAVIVAANEELQILTPEAAVEAADSIKVAFSDGTEVAGTIKQMDKISGMAIVSVPTSAIDSELLLNVKPIELGNSYSVKTGDLIVAIGSPAGMVHSTGYGFVSYVTRNVQVTDGITRVIHADLKSNAQMGTFLMNTSGQIVGWVTDAFQSETGQDVTAAMAISDYKSILEKMTNGTPIPYLGIRSQEVSSAMNESGMPLGIYVVDCAADSPAYNAGIQSGDIITRIGNQDIITMKDYQVKLESLKADELVNVTVKRNGRDEYKELVYPVTIGAR